MKQRLNQLESTENEEIGEMDLERSLLAGELESENDKVRKVCLISRVFVILVYYTSILFQ